MCHNCHCQLSMLALSNAGTVKCWHWQLLTKASPIFQQYVHRIAADLSLPASTSEQQQVVFDALLSLPSFCRKNVLPKTGRWFSWHESAEAMLKEWWATRMLLEWYLSSEALPNPDDLQDKSLNELRRAGLGGFKLAYLVTSAQAWENCHVLLEGGRPLWTWYTDQVENCKDGDASYQYALDMCESWHKSPQLLQLASIMTNFSLTCFKPVVEWSDDIDNFAKKVIEYVVNLLGQRASSLAKHSAPPYCWAGLLSGEDRDGYYLKSDFRYLSELEVSKAPMAASLAEDLRSSFDSPCRLVCLQFESGLVNLARENLESLIFNLPDAKIVEDIHQKIRTNQHKHSNDAMTPGKIQMLCNTSGVLESRGIKHVGKLTKDQFVSQWPRTSGDFKAKDLTSPRSHKLPKSMGRILAKVRTWPALTENQLAASFSGWHWLRTYREYKLHLQGVKLKVGQFKVTVPLFVL